MNRNYFSYWYKRIIREGLENIRLIIGLGLGWSFGHYIHPIVGILYIGYTLVGELIRKYN